MLRILALLLIPFATANASGWTTPAEATKFATTPTYADSAAYLQRLADAAPERLKLVSMGRSPEGRDLWVAIAASGGEFTPEAARSSGKQILFVQAGIHAGEIEGKDAGLMLLRDLVLAKKPPAKLDHTILLYLPMFNVDGHERRSPYNRVNQNGPDDKGWRATAQNLNLNRDYMKADAPEMQAWLAFWNAWLPDFLIDVHTTDGADYQYDLTWYTEDWGNLHPAVKAWQDEALKDRAFPRAEKHGHLLSPYLELVDHHDITKGIGNFGSGPRFSTGYAALQNRAGLLIETHMLKPYAVRVKATYDVLVEILREMESHPGQLRAAVTKADAQAAEHEAPIALDFAQDGKSVPYVLKSYAFTQTHSDLSNDAWTQYDPTKKKNYTVPFFRDLRVTDSATAPAAYLIPAAWQDAIAKLRQHGVRIDVLDAPVTTAATAYRLSDAKWATAPFEGRVMIKQFHAVEEARTDTYSAGSALVRMDQRTANVIAHLLEPQAPDSLLRWGYFNIVFEQREYADSRIGEGIARELLKQHPELRAAFDEKLKDPAFAKSAEARLDFFFQRSLWHDEKLGLYPIVKLDAQQLAALMAPRAEQAH